MPEIPAKPAVRSLNELIRTGEVCRSLRSKKLFYQTEEEASDITSAGPFWCAHTHIARSQHRNATNWVESKATRSIEL